MFLTFKMKLVHNEPYNEMKHVCRCPQMSVFMHPPQFKAFIKVDAINEWKAVFCILRKTADITKYDNEVW